MSRRVGALLSAAVLLGAITFAARPTEPQTPPPTSTEPAMQSEPRAPARGPRHIDHAPALEAFAIPPGTVFERVEVRADGAVPDAIAIGEVVIYGNTHGNIPASTGTSFVVDDIATVSGGGCRVKRYEFPVVGKVNPLGVGGPYRVDFALYSNCPGAVPSNPPGASVLIAGTAGHAEFPDDAPRAVSFTLPGAGIALPSNNVWFGVRFNRPNAGLLVGGVASTGASCDGFDFPGFPCRGALGGFPDHPHASINLQLIADKTCTESFAGYKNNVPSGPVINPGTNTWLVDDIRLAAPQCQMTAYEVVVRGVGSYEFEMRTNCEGDVIPGTQKIGHITSGSSPRLFRYEFNPPISLPESLWLGARVQNSTAGIITSGTQACIGETAAHYGVPNPTQCVIHDPGQGSILPIGVHGGVNLMITCAGQPPIGACCDMIFPRCVGGPDDGRLCCPDDGDLPPYCRLEPYAPYQFYYYPPCTAPGTCELACREAPQMNCPWRYPQWTSQETPGWIAGAACDPDPFPFACGAAACCRPDDVCQNLTVNACYAVEPTTALRQWQRDYYCGDSGQHCPINACLAHEGDCMFAHQEPGCGWVACCDSICRTDAYCCQVEWDRNCVEAASIQCEEPEHYSCTGPWYTGPLEVEADSVTFFSNRLARQDPKAPLFCCSGNGSGNAGFGTTWLKLIATDSSARVSTCESDPTGDSLINVFSVGDPTSDETACASLVPLACSDDVDECGEGRHGQICVTGLTPGQPYYIVVASKTPADRGLHQLQIRSPCFTEPIWVPDDCNKNELADGCELGRRTASDCNLNHVLDECDIAEGTSFDCDDNAIPDDCDGIIDDCNNNAVPDLCDLRDATSVDCNHDDVPDECTLADGTTPDCNRNGVPDDCDIAGALLPDCDFDGTPDPCEIHQDNYDCDCDGIDNAKEVDCNENDWPDECDIVIGAADCDGDGWLDQCEIAYELAQDCNANHAPDNCELAEGAYPDCNLDGEIDACDIADGSSIDCNANGFPDECDLTGGVMLDSDSDGIPNECEPDCQPNGVIDDLDIALGTSRDCNADGRPDECGPADHCGLLRLVPWGPPNWSGYGVALAVDGDRILVGAPFSQGGIGGAFIFRRGSNGWARQTKFVPPPELRGDPRYGISVALSANLAVIGAPGVPCDENFGCGAGYVYRHDGHRWVFEQKLVPSNARESFEFGVAVATDGARILVGSQTSSDDVYVFEHEQSGWTEKLRLPVSNVNAIALSNTVAMIGSEGDGAVVFRYDGKQWMHEADLAVPQAGERAFSLDGDVAVIGAPSANNGAVSVFRRGAGTWNLEQVLPNPLPNEIWEFGTAVSVLGNRIVVGAPGADFLPGCFGRGRAFVYTYTGNVWTQLGSVCNRDPTREPIGFGMSVASDDHVIAIGANSSDDYPLCCGDAYLIEWRGPDCDEDAAPDACEVSLGESDDCDNNGIPDTCPCGLAPLSASTTGVISSGCAADCQTDGIADYLDIRAGTSADCNLDGVPDECGLYALSYSTIASLDDADPAAYHTLALADFDGDTDRDLFAVQGWPGALYLNRGGGQFTRAQVVVNAAGHDTGFNYDIDTGDLDGDGDTDIVYAMAFPNSEDGVAYVVLNQGVDFRRSPPRFNVDVRNIDPDPTHKLGLRVHATKLTDIDWDGDLDLVLGYGRWYAQTPGNVGVYLNDGQANFSLVSASMVGLTPRAVALTDLDGDGDLDAVTVHQESDDLCILINRGAPQLGQWLGFEPQMRIPIGLDAEAQTFDVAAADFDADGDPDIVFAMAGANAVGTMLNLGNGPDGWGGFAPATRYGVAQLPLFVTTIDLNRDGWPDIAAAETVEKSIALLGNLGRASDGSWRGFSTPVRSPAGAGPVWIEPMDIDDDGSPELLVSNRGFFSGFFYQDLGDSSITMMEQDRLSRFEDHFTLEYELDAKKWPISYRAEVVGFHIGEHPPYFLMLDDVDFVESRPIDLSRDSAAELRFYLHRSYYSDDERLYVEFWGEGGWHPLMEIPPGYDQDFEGRDVLTLFRVDLPPEAFHSRFRFRFRKAPFFSQEWFLDDVALSVRPRDCDGNAILDGCEIADDPATDRNANRALDICDLDFDGDGDVDLRDVAVLFACFSGEAPASPACAAVDFYNQQVNLIDFADAAALIAAISGPR